MAFTIRRATSADAARIAAVEIQTWQIAYRQLMPEAFLAGLSVAEKTIQWRQNLAKHGLAGQKRVVVAEQDAAIVGFARVGRMAAAEPSGLLYLLYVLPEHWGQGVGAALLGAGLSELRALDVRSAELWVLRDNLRARRFYERAGWQPDGRTTTAQYGGVALDAVCYHYTITDHIAAA